MATTLDLINKARVQSAGQASGPGDGPAAPAVPEAPAATAAAPASVMALVAAANTPADSPPFVVRDYNLTDAKADAARIVSRIANSQAAQVARQLAALGIEKASDKASKVAETAKSSYAKGCARAKAKAQQFTTGESGDSDWINDVLENSGGTATSAASVAVPSTSSNPLESRKTRKDSAIETIQSAIESDLAKTAVSAGAHAFVAAAGSKLGIPPAMSNMAAAESIERGVDHLQKNSSAAAHATVGFGIDHAPALAGVIGGVTAVAVDTLPGLVGDAATAAIHAAGMASRLASASMEAYRQASSDANTSTEETTGVGPVITIVEDEEKEEDQQQQSCSIAAGASSSSEEDASSDDEDWQDAK